jgi:hypothetical protein
MLVLPKVGKKCTRRALYGAWQNGATQCTLLDCVLLPHQRVLYLSYRHKEVVFFEFCLLTGQVPTCVCRYVDVGLLVYFSRTNPLIDFKSST